MDALPETLLDALVWYMVFVLSVTAHEAAHAWAARLLGDPTAYETGQVTLNPAPHLRREPIGAIVVPFVTYFLGGWMMGWASAPYDPHWAQRYPKRAGWMALAGPVANLVLLLIAVAIVRVGLLTEVYTALPGQRFQFPAIAAPAQGVPIQVAELVSILFMLNFILFLFNLLPVPPLDGSAIVQLFMPEETARRWQTAIRQPQMALFGLILAFVVFSRLGDSLYHVALRVVYPEQTWQ